VAEEQNSEHVISLFRFRMRDLTPTQRDEYRSTAERLLTLASAMPGVISFRYYTSDNHEMLAVVEFASAEALTAWSSVETRA
jgi:heme-degrading monooxygenase HmoA